MPTPVENVRIARLTASRRRPFPAFADAFGSPLNEEIVALHGKGQTPFPTKPKFAVDHARPNMFDAGTVRGGFTLVEVLIVVLILGILTAVAAPQYAASITRYNLEAAAKRVAADLEMARREAKKQGKSIAVQFNVPANAYEIPEVADIDRPAHSYAVDLSKSGYPADMIYADFAGGSIVAFDMYGQPDSGGQVLLQVSGQQRTIDVDAHTGRVNVY